MSNLSSIGIALIALMACAGCAPTESRAEVNPRQQTVYRQMYDGPRLPRDQVALLQVRLAEGCDTEFLPERNGGFTSNSRCADKARAFIVSVNGRPYPDQRVAVEVPAGSADVEIACMRGARGERLMRTYKLLGANAYEIDAAVGNQHCAPILVMLGRVH